MVCWLAGGEEHIATKAGSLGGREVLVIKDSAEPGRVKLLYSLCRKAAPSLLCPSSGDLIIFPKS
jgi:hypothetical protein